MSVATASQLTEAAVRSINNAFVRYGTIVNETITPGDPRCTKSMVESITLPKQLRELYLLRLRPNESYRLGYLTVLPLQEVHDAFVTSTDSVVFAHDPNTSRRFAYIRNAPESVYVSTSACDGRYVSFHELVDAVVSCANAE